MLADDEEDGNPEIGKEPVHAAAIGWWRAAEHAPGAGRIQGVYLPVQESQSGLCLFELAGERVLTEVAVATKVSKLVLDFADTVIGCACGGTRKDEGTDLPRRQPGEASDGSPSHGVSNDVGMFDAEVVHERDEVGAKGPAAGRHVTAAQPPTAGVVHGAAEAAAELGELLPPGEVVSARAVQEHQVITGAVLLEVEPGPVHAGIGHTGSLAAERDDRTRVRGFATQSGGSGSLRP